MKKLVLPLALSFGVLLCLASQAQTFSSLEERMSAEEFKAAGLEKLTPGELARLNEWLRVARPSPAAYSGLQPGSAAPVDRIGLPDNTPRVTIVSQIEGEFTGWNGHTVFKLKNGQVWRQSDSSSQLAGIKLQSPAVHIEPAILGGWRLSVEGYNSTTRVKRVR